MSKITDSARGEMCQIRYHMVCNHDRDTTVWCHGIGSAAGKGIGMKAPDILGAYGCSACHDLYDRRIPIPRDTHMTRVDVELGFWEGHARSVCILIAKGLVVMSGGRLEIA